MAIAILCVVVALLSVASAVLGFIAQATKLNPDEIQFDESAYVCVYPAKPAYALGICALPLLVAAMIISTVAGGCFGCCVKPQQGGASGSWRVKGAVCCVASWMAATVAVANYVLGVSWNAATTRDAVAMGLYYRCHYLKDDASFATAAVLTLVAAALGISSFTMILAPPAPAPAAGAEPKHDGQQQPVAGVGVVGEACQNQQSSSAPPPPHGQAHALV